MTHRELIINPAGGLANRMRAIASGISLSAELSKSGASDLRIVWLKNWELNAGFCDIFELPELLRGKIEYPSQLRYSLLYSIPRKKNLYITSLTHRRYGAALYDLSASYRRLFAADKDGKKILSAVREALSKGKPCYIQAGTIFYPFDSTLYKELFRPTAEIIARANDRLERLGPCKTGIHIRRSDNAESIKHSPDKLFIDKIEEILAGDATAGFYLATDDEAVKHKFRRIFGDRIITSPTVADRNSTAGIKEAAVELFTLAGTDRIFGSYYSSFSEAAAMIGQKPFEQLKIR